MKNDLVKGIKALIYQKMNELVVEELLRHLPIKEMMKMSETNGIIYAEIRRLISLRHIDKNVCWYDTCCVQYCGYSTLERYSKYGKPMTCAKFWTTAIRKMRRRLGDFATFYGVSIHGCGDLINFAPFSAVRSVYLVDCTAVKDLSALENIYELKLRWCKKVSDVSALGRLHTIEIYECHGIYDVSALGNVHTLSIFRCSNIRDVSALGRVNVLWLANCRNITDVSCLNGVKRLVIDNCEKITGISTLRYVYDLDVAVVTEGIDVSQLTSIPHKRFYHCRLIDKQDKPPCQPNVVNACVERRG